MPMPKLLQTRGKVDPETEKKIAEWTPTLKQVWAQVIQKPGMGLPALGIPAIVPHTDVGTAGINMVSKEIEIDANFVDRLLDAGMKLEDIFTAICIHEVGHYRFHPYDYATLLLELNALRDPKRDNGDIGVMCNQIRLLFDDFCDNLSVLRRGVPDHKLDQMYIGMTKGIGPDGSISPVMQLMLAYLKEVSDPHIDFGVDKKDFDKKMTEKFNQIKRINFFDDESIEYNIVRFAAIIEDIMTPPTCGGFALFPLDRGEAEKALRQIVGKVSKEDWQKLKKWVEENSSYNASKDDPKDKPPAHPPVGRRGGNGREEAVMADVAYYKMLADKYPVSILGLPIAVSDSTFPAGIEEWSVDDEADDLDPFASFGQVMPGITKKVRREPLTVFGNKVTPPDSIVVLDSSGSMQNPTVYESTAVTGAFAISLAYMNNGAKVDVINFSNSVTVTPYQDEDHVLGALVEYKGNGTSPPVKELRKLLEGTRKDITVITDGFSGASPADIKEFMDILLEIKKTNRVSFVFVDGPQSDYSSVEPYKEQLEPNFHITQRGEDVGGIVIGKDMAWLSV